MQLLKTQSRPSSITNPDYERSYFGGKFAMSIVCNERSVFSIALFLSSSSAVHSATVGSRDLKAGEVRSSTAPSSPGNK